MIGAHGPQTAGLGEIAVEATHVQLRWDRGHLIDDHVGPGPADRLCDLIGIERVGDYRHGTQLVEHRLL